MTEGSFIWRDGKVFGLLTIIVNKAQDFSGPDEDEIDALPDSLILQIQKYFLSGPDIILLPTLSCYSLSV